MAEIKKGLYKHFKGGNYIVKGTAKHSETKDMFVVYESVEVTRLGDPAGTLYIRPAEMFSDEVNRPELNYKGPRFIYIGD